MQTIIVGSQSFTVMKMNAFEANALLLRIKNIALPVIGGLQKAMPKSGEGSILDAEIGDVANVLCEHLNEEVMESIVFPMFKNSRVASVEKKIVIDGPTPMNMCFTVDDLSDFYVLVWEVLKLNFTPFFQKLAANFGSLTAEPKKA